MFSTTNNKKSTSVLSIKAPGSYVIGRMFMLFHERFRGYPFMKSLFETLGLPAELPLKNLNHVDFGNLVSYLNIQNLS